MAVLWHGCHTRQKGSKASNLFPPSSSFLRCKASWTMESSGQCLAMAGAALRKAAKGLGHSLAARLLGSWDSCKGLRTEKKKTESF